MQHDCDPNAICRDELNGYQCQCPVGFADSSPDPSKPGRLCVQPKPDEAVSADFIDELIAHFRTLTKAQFLEFSKNPAFPYEMFKFYSYTYMAINYGNPSYLKESVMYEWNRLDQATKDHIAKNWRTQYRSIVKSELQHN
ncbi:hypothetical protein GCK32_017283 [Trichostrongylus colubriformis]|uniref:EGF-like calcium-binding domain-containing protein n=1 Tax=Trichostrongylus colubriformis TaxID=6319 RepID=A0AAN8IGN7_TRICO